MLSCLWDDAYKRTLAANRFRLLLSEWSFTIYPMPYNGNEGRKEFFYLMMHSTHFSYGVRYICHPTDRIIHTTAFVTPVMEQWLEREIAQRVDLEGSIRRPVAP